MYIYMYITAIENFESQNYILYTEASSGADLGELINLKLRKRNQISLVCQIIEGVIDHFTIFWKERGKAKLNAGGEFIIKHEVL